MKNNFNGKLIKKGGKLAMASPTMEKMYKEFIDSIPEGGTVEFFSEATSEDATLAQMAKAHSLIRELALHTGIAFKDIKLVVKNDAGLCYEGLAANGTKGLICKSFSECSSTELSLAIQAAISLGIKVNCPVS